MGNELGVDEMSLDGNGLDPREFGQVRVFEGFLTMASWCITAGLMCVAVVLSSASSADSVTPITLDMKSAVQLAVKTNPQIAGASAYAEMAAAQADKAGSALRPNLSAESGYSYLSKETMFGTTAVWERDTVVNRVALQQLVYSGGQAEANVSRARHGYMAADYGSAAARADVAANAAIAYFRARQAGEQLEVALASVRSLDAGLDAASKMHESGMVTKSDVLRAEVALTSARESVIVARNNSAAAMAALRAAIGLSQDTAIDLATDAVDDVPGLKKDAAPVERPEVAAAVASVQSAEAGSKAAKASRLPTMFFAADYFNQPTGSEFPRLSNTLQAGVVVRLNVFDGGLTRAGIDEAEAAARRARQELEAQRRRVELEQQTAALDLDSANARVETTAGQVRSAEESLRVLEAGYQEGMSPLTDVLSAEAALTAARFSRLAALYDARIARVSLLRAYGQTGALMR